MQPDFWLQRWQQGQIGFHRGEVMPLLEKHWPALQVAPGSRVLVPLCGKSLDMHWLAAQGYRVLGVEISPLAVEQFFAEAGLQPERRTSPLGEHYGAGPIEIIRGDAFTLDDDTLAGIAGIYDRAALIALPPELRQRYRDTVYARLPAGGRALVITLEYPQMEKAGPPFSVEQAEMESLAPSWRVELAERRDILAQEPGFRAEGVSALSTAVYRMQRAGN